MLISYRVTCSFYSHPSLCSFSVKSNYSIDHHRHFSLYLSRKNSPHPSVLHLQHNSWLIKQSILELSSTECCCSSNFCTRTCGGERERMISLCKLGFFNRWSENIVHEISAGKSLWKWMFNRRLFVLHLDNQLHHYHDRRRFRLSLDRVHRYHHRHPPHIQSSFSDNYNRRKNKSITLFETFARIYFISLFDIFDGRPKVVRERDIFPSNRAVVCWMRCS